MLKKTMTYTDYDGNERTEDFYFDLNQAEIMEMELGTAGGMQNFIQRIIDAKDVPELASLFKQIILKAYGKKSDDGRRFIKKDEFIEDFVSTPAYSMLYMELCTDSDKAAAFMNAIIPKVDEKKETPATIAAINSK